MKKNKEKVIEVLNRSKKRIIVGVSILGVIAIGTGALATAFLYNRVKSNINYTEEQAKEIALANTPGEVVKVEKDIDLEDGILEYEIKIKDGNNILRDVTVDATLGAIKD